MIRNYMHRKVYLANTSFMCSLGFYVLNILIEVLKLIPSWTESHDFWYVVASAGSLHAQVLPACDKGHCSK